MNNQFRRKGIFFPLLLVGLGIFLLLINLGVIPGTSRENLLTYWPVILILAGLDGLWRRDGLVWPLLLLGLGVLFLLGNLGYLDVRALPLLSKIWPILLVAIGIDVAFGRNQGGWRVILRAGIGILVVVAIFWLAITSPTGIGTREVSIEQKTSGETSSQVDLSILAGQLMISGGAQPGQLLAGKAVLPRNAALQPIYQPAVDGKSELELKMDYEGASLAGSGTVYDFRYQLASKLPITLNTQVVAGELVLDLAQTELLGLETEMAVGSQTVTIPCNTGMSVDLKQAVGSVTLILPPGCDVRIHLDNALVNTTLPAGYMRTENEVTNTSQVTSAGVVDIRIGLAVGAVDIREAK